MGIDIIGRDREVKLLQDTIISSSKCGFGVTIGLNGKWGQGKSFILQQFAEKSEDMSIKVGEKSEKTPIIITYNCWANDIYPDPIRPLCQLIYEKYIPFIDRCKEKVVKNISSLFKLFGNMIDSLECLNKIIDRFEKIFGSENGEENKNLLNKSSYEKIVYYIKKSIIRISQEKPLILIIDELDRCLPEYQLKVFESIHQLFDEESKNFIIISFDSEKIGKTIKDIFGTEYEVYLEKIIDVYIRINDTEAKSHYLDLFEEYISFFNDNKCEYVDVKNVINEVLDGAYFTIREKIKIIKLAQTIHKKVAYNTSPDIALLIFEIMAVAWGIVLNRSAKNVKFGAWITADYPTNAKEYDEYEIMSVNYKNILCKCIYSPFDCDFYKSSNFQFTKNVLGRSLDLWIDYLDVSYIGMKRISLPNDISNCRMFLREMHNFI